MTSSPKPSRGRPRDPAIDDAVLAATRALLVEIGCDQLSMVAIADRAGVGRPALYRRWPSKTHLVFEAVFGWQDAPTPVTQARDADDWVRRSFAYTRELFGRPDVKAALPWLLASLRDHPELRAVLWREFGAPGVAMLERTLRAEGHGAGEAALEANAAMTLIIGASMIVELLGDPASGVAERLPGLIRLPDREP
ncbi:MAG TPA: TetR/AcrR family transcriptional regulator [Amycolatopsis sp.]|nr:TetR/AcrR family transcriptional regulator [Amycolatopsis sp.]